MITADALHTQRAHAEYLHERGAGFVFTVKENQPTLFAAPDALPWSQTPVTFRATDTGHGRVTTRTIQVLPAPAGLPFPHVTQVWLIERYTRGPDSSLLPAGGLFRRTVRAHPPSRTHRPMLIVNQRHLRIVRISSINASSVDQFWVA
ncbi:MAG TPA: hypothetical protein VFO16_19545 [Pseudonocardiaceae bacterium]|nr:hypothetical protein [Pseudonocardiaceae bacterium]